MSEIVTAALLNTHLRDNLLEVGPHVRVRKTAAESVTSSTTLQNDDHLLFAIAANEVWLIRCQVYYEGSATGDGKLAWAVPAGATGAHSLLRADTALVLGTSMTPNLAAALTFGADGTFRTAWAEAIVVNGATPGTVNLQWAQNVSDAVPLNFLINGWLDAHRIG